ncbi:hypothetical protein N8612_00450 [Verrucomicrobia bacterium]|jgi:hypothetical protein|nr:hypothetical protein [Verrucomicrobiota bacterium]
MIHPADGILQIEVHRVTGFIDLTSGQPPELPTWTPREGFAGARILRDAFDCERTLASLQASAQGYRLVKFPLASRSVTVECWTVYGEFKNVDELE